MGLEQLNFCTLVKRIVATDEFHAGVFSSERCVGCGPIPHWLDYMVHAHLQAQIDRATYHLSLLTDEEKPDGG